MAEFLNNPATVQISGSQWEVLLEPLDYQFTDKSFPPWTVPAGKLTDGPSVPAFLNWLTPRRKFMLSGYLHDDLRVKWATGNAATDGMLRDAVMAETKHTLRDMNAFQAYLVYLGVRIGTLIKFKSEPSDDIVWAAQKRYATHLGVPLTRIEFDKKHCELKVKELP